MILIQICCGEQQLEMVFFVFLYLFVPGALMHFLPESHDRFVSVRSSRVGV